MPLDILGLLGRGFMVAAVVIFIAGTSIGPIQDVMLDQPNHDIEDAQGDVILDGESWMDSGHILAVKKLPNLFMLGIIILAFWMTAKYANRREGGPGGF